MTKANDNIDPTANMSPVGKALFEALKPASPEEQIKRLRAVGEGRSLSAMATEAFISTRNEDYADKFMGGHNED